MEPLIDFNFEELAKLANSNVDAFNHKRSLLINELISSAPRELQTRLHHLQHLVDGLCAENEDPLKTCAKIFQLLQITLHGENGLSDNLSRLKNMLEPANDEDSF